MTTTNMVVGVTGHRPDKLGGYGKKTDDALYDLAKEYMSILKPDEVITGMAIGWDMAVAKVCADVGIPFTAAVPFKGQEGKWPDFTKDWYYKLLDRAQQVINVSAKDFFTVDFMYERNAWIVDHCDLVLALWNGSEGGTANTIWYATRKNKHIWNLWDYYAEFKRK